MGLPGSTRSGEKATKKSWSTLSPVDDSLGSNTSRVKPGKVVLSSTTICGRRMRGNNMSAASRMKELSGSLVLLSGVGTQMITTSAFPNTSGLSLAMSLPEATSGPSTDEGTSAMCDRPDLMAFTFAAMRS